jgi:hypothetical protein
MPLNNDPDDTSHPHYVTTSADIAINNYKDGDPSAIMFKNAHIIDSTGRDPYLSDVLIKGERIKQVGKINIQLDKGP